jgi:hypothetical protein
MGNLLDDGVAHIACTSGAILRFNDRTQLHTEKNGFKKKSANHVGNR